MSTPSTSLKRIALAAGLCLSLAACDGGFSPMANLFGPGPEAGAAPTIPRPDPDSRGVISYATYQVIVARQGDTIPDMAQRVGLDGQELAAHNGLPVSYRPRPGEVLALPRNVGGSPADNVWDPTVWTPGQAGVQTGGIESSALGPATGAPGAAPTPVTPGEFNPFTGGTDGPPVIDPIRHRVQAGETAFSIARRYGVSVTALARWNGLDSEMTVRENQELLIPVKNTGDAVRTASAAAPAAPEPAADAEVNAPGTPTAVTPPPSAAAPLPADENIDEEVALPAPNLAEDRTPSTAAQGRLLTPVANASILSGYAPNGPSRNEGIDFAAPAGTVVRAAEDGEVALISDSLGGLGTILLIRHADDLMTVYGRITDVTLEKGDRVSRGQPIGIVADGATPNVHFEVRRGTASVDPGPYLGI